MTADTPSPLHRSVRWSFPGFVFASFLLLPIAQQWQEALFAKFGFANSLTPSPLHLAASIGGILLIFITPFTSWVAAMVLEKEPRSIGTRCLIFWNMLLMMIAALYAAAVLLGTLGIILFGA